MNNKVAVSIVVVAVIAILLAVGYLSLQGDRGEITATAPQTGSPALDTVTVPTPQSAPAATPAYSQYAAIVINEFELNPPGSDLGNEWVELYNPSSADVNLGGWSLSTGLARGILQGVTIPPGAMIAANGYFVVTHSTQWLDNQDEIIILSDSTGYSIDRTPSRSDTDDDDRSWQREPNGGSLWAFKAASRGVPN